MNQYFRVACSNLYVYPSALPCYPIFRPPSFRCSIPHSRQIPLIHINDAADPSSTFAASGPHRW